MGKPAQEDSEAAKEVKRLEEVWRSAFSTYSKEKSAPQPGSHKKAKKQILCPFADADGQAMFTCPPTPAIQTEVLRLVSTSRVDYDLPLSLDEDHLIDGDLSEDQRKVHVVEHTQSEDQSKVIITELPPTRDITKQLRENGRDCEH